MSVFMLCEQALGLLNASDLRDLGTEGTTLLEALNYDGLVAARAQHEAVVCARCFASVRDKLLQAHPWLFARKDAPPAQLSASLSGWRFTYALPADCLKMLALVPGTRPETQNAEALYYHGTGAVSLSHYEIIGRTLCCNHKNVRLRYTARVADTTLWPPCFAGAFCSMLAAEIAPSVCPSAGGGPLVPVGGSAGTQSAVQAAMQTAAQMALAAIVQARAAGEIASAHELPAQPLTGYDYSGIISGFDQGPSPL
jgi:hypothetical protein